VDPLSSRDVSFTLITCAQQMSSQATVISTAQGL
jgi:hypothetical protein